MQLRIQASEQNLRANLFRIIIQWQCVRMCVFSIYIIVILIFFHFYFFILLHLCHMFNYCRLVFEYF